MQSIKFTDSKIIIDNGDWLCLKVDNKYQTREFIDNKKDKPYVAELKEYRQKRSLDANAYFWVLCQKLAEVLHTDKDSVYLMMLERYGVFTHLIVKPNVVDRVKQEWRTVKELGEVTINGTTGVQLQCYFGSSTFNTKEMSLLIDGIVSECKEVGIPTETPEELARMCSEWQT